METILLILLFNFAHCQSSIVASGAPSYTIGEVFPVMQSIQKESVSLGVPKFEIPIEQPKTIVKKLTWWQRILKMFNFK